jgi:hypothetical protein
VPPREATHDWERMMRAEYCEMPGLTLTKCQVQRLCGLDAETCDALLNLMVNEHFLRKTCDNQYVRADLER